MNWCSSREVRGVERIYDNKKVIEIRWGDVSHISN